MEKFKPLEDAKIREIRKLAADQSLPLSEIADRVGVSPRTVWKYGKQARQDVVEQSGPQEEPVKATQGNASAFVDDPDIMCKLKELELLKIEQEIARVKGALIEPEQFENLVLQLKYHVDFDHIGEPDIPDHILSMCPWCGASDDEGMQHVEGGYVCVSCGANVGE